MERFSFFVLVLWIAAPLRAQYCPISCCTMTGQLNVPALNGIVKADQQAGATADVKIAACISALSSGGICDARGFGATTQTIASPIVVGNGKAVTLLFDPSTLFQPSSASTTMLKLYKGAHVYGFNANLGAYASTYSVPVISVSDNIRDTDHFELIDTNITGVFGTPPAGSACLSLTASSSSQSIDFVHVQRFRCNYLQRAFSFIATSTGFINGNLFSDLVFDGCTQCVYLSGAAVNAPVSGNAFSNVIIQSQSWTTDPFYLTGYAVDNSFTGIVVWDTLGSYDVKLQANAIGNFFEGAFFKGLSDSSGSYNAFINLYPGSAQSGLVSSRLYLLQGFNPNSASFVNAFSGLCPNISSTQTCFIYWGNGTDNAELDFNYAGANSPSNNIHMYVPGGTPGLKVYRDGSMGWAGGTRIGTSNNIPQYCGQAGFSGGTTSFSLPCSWVTTTSHCMATWNGAVTGGALSYVTASGSVTLTSSSANSNYASVFCSVN